MYLQYKNLKIEDVKFFFIGNVILFVKKKDIQASYNNYKSFVTNNIVPKLEFSLQLWFQTLGGVIITDIYFISECESFTFYCYTYFELLEKDLKILKKWGIGYTPFIPDI